MSYREAMLRAEEKSKAIVATWPGYHRDLLTEWMKRYDPAGGAQSTLDYTPRSGWSWRRYIVQGPAPAVAGAEVIRILSEFTVQFRPGASPTPVAVAYVVRVRTYEESRVLSRLIDAGFLIEEDVQHHPCAG